jgi:hypothetical protein
MVAGGIVFEGGTGTNTLVGPGVDTTWHVTSAGAGDVAGPSFVGFTGIENLVGGETRRQHRQRDLERPR